MLVGAVCARQSWAGHSEVTLPLWALAEDWSGQATITARLIAWTGEELAALTVKDVEVGPEAAMVGPLRAPTPAGPFVVDVQLVADGIKVGRRYVLTGADHLGDLSDAEADPMQVNVSVEDAEGRPLPGDDWQIEVSQPAKTP